MAKIAINNRKNLIFISIFILLYIILLIFLKDKILFTPDFGESDAYHLNLSLKYYLADNLKHNILPFWTDKLQGGFPLFSEGQIGALFLPNIIFLKFLPFALGYNLLLVFSLFCLSLGFYLFLRELKINNLLAFLFSLIFTFNGALSLRWVHPNLIQSFSLIPFLFYFYLKYLSSKKKIYLILFPLFLSQMIFAGHLQAVYLSLFAFIIWLCIYSYLNYKKIKLIINHLCVFLFLILSGIIISSVQLLPTYILTTQSSRSLGLPYQIATSFPFSWGELRAFFNPDVYGTPKLGTYPPYSANWGIYWENTPYLGVIFFIILIFILINRRKYIFKDKFILLLLSIISLLILLALGKNSPLYLVYNFLPFNLFRSPSKYLLIANFFLVILGAVLLNYFVSNQKNKLLKFFIVILLVFNIIDLANFAFNYHLFLDKQDVLKIPASRDYIDNSLTISLDQPESWNNIFLKSGWSKQEDQQTYLFFKNYLYPNSNLVFNKNIYDINTGGFRLKRIDYLKNLIQKNIEIRDGNYIVDERLIDLFNILGIKNIISSRKIQSNSFDLIKNLHSLKYNIYLYKSKNKDHSFYYIPETITKINYLADFESVYIDGDLSTGKSLAENYRANIKAEYNITQASKENSSFRLKGDFLSSTLVVFRQNYYPDWSIYIDNKKVKPIKINLVHIGAEVPKGIHEVTLRYENKYFKLGLLISAVYLIVFLIIVKKIKL